MSLSSTPLLAGGKISGKIVSEKTGEQVSGAAVTASSGMKSYNERSDSEGNYIFNNLPPGKYCVRLGDRYKNQAAPHGYFQLIVSEGETTSSIDFQILSLEKYQIEGTVKNGDGDPIEGAEIKFTRQYNPAEREFNYIPSFGIMAVSDDQGKFKFEIEGKKGQELYITASKDGYAPYKGRPFTLEDSGKSCQTEIIMTRGALITGWVKDGEGNAVPDAQVSVFDKGKRLKAVTDGDGKFELQNASMGKHQLTIECDGYAKLKKEVEVGPNENKPVNIELGTASYIKGRVIDSGGNSLEKARLYLTCKDPRYSAYKSTKYDGRFAFDDVPEGRYTLTVKKEGYCTLVMNDVKADDDACAVTLKKAVSIKGHVLDASTGKPVESIRVAPMESQEGSDKYKHIDSGKFSNKDGAFEIQSINPERKYKIFVEAEGYAIAQGPDVTYTGPDQDLTIKLGKGAEINGRVIDAESKKAVPEAVVIVTAPGQNVDDKLEWGKDEDFDCSSIITGSLTGLDGNFKCKNVPQGKWRVVATKKGYKQKGDNVVELDPARGNADTVIQMNKQ